MEGSPHNKKGGFGPPFLMLPGKADPNKKPRLQGRRGGTTMTPRWGSENITSTQ